MYLFNRSIPLSERARLIPLIQDNVDRWKQVFDSDNPLAEHWPGKAESTGLG